MIKKFAFCLLIVFLSITSAFTQTPNLSQKMDSQPKEKVLNTALLKHYPIFLIFYADWCAESYDYILIIKEIEKVWGDKVLFIKVDVEDKANQPLIEKYKKIYNLKHLPVTVVYEKGGKEVKNFTRSKLKKELEEIVKEIIN